MGTKGLPARSASLFFNPVWKEDMRWVESKASAIDRVIGLITPTVRGEIAVEMGEAVCEADCLSLLCDDLRWECFQQP
jgi:hypothetical protein